jgi:hypothetical protein
MNVTERHKRKFLDFVYKELKHKQELNVLEFGVSERGLSTSLFLKLCERNNGNLISVDINKNSKKFNSKYWTFINCRDDDYKTIESKIINQKFDVIYLDTIHKAQHVKKIIYHYYNYLKIGGFFYVDDTSCLPYLKTREKNNFSQEINNLETFEKILEIYNSNHESLNLEFSFVGTGIAKLQKLNSMKLSNETNIRFRKYSFLNILRKILLGVKKIFS